MIGIRNIQRKLGIISTILLTIILLTTWIRAGIRADYGIPIGLYGYIVLLMLVINFVLLIVYISDIFLKFPQVLITGFVAVSIFAGIGLLALEFYRSNLPLPHAHAVYTNSWESIQELVQEDELNFLHIPNKESLITLNEPTFDDLDRFAKESGITMHHYTPLLKEDNPYGDITTNELENHLHHLRVESLPALLLVGEGEVEKLNIEDENLVDVLRIHLSRIAFLTE